MRVIGGKFRSRLIKFPKGKKTRPTKDKVRQAVFNMIAAVVPGSCVLDLYAGSGAFGIEALSRGAREAVFVDEDGQSIRTIAGNLRELGVAPETAPVIRADTAAAVRQLARQGKRFDLIFMDPPYQKGLIKEGLIIIMKYDILNPSGFVIAEHYTNDDVAIGESILRLTSQRHYGDTVVSLFSFHRKEKISRS